MAKKQLPRRPRLHQLSPALAESDSPYLWGLLTVIVIVAIAGFATHFVDQLHYDNQLSQVQQSYSGMQTTNDEQSDDLSFLILNSQSTINCYNLSSSYAQKLCHEHDDKF
jgi:hypothetical protein